MAQLPATGSDYLPWPQPMGSEDKRAQEGQRTVVIEQERPQRGSLEGKGAEGRGRAGRP